MPRPGPCAHTLLLVIAVCACARSSADVPTAGPVSSGAEPAPEVTGHTFVSTERNEEFDGIEFDDPMARADYGQVALKTADEAREVAEAAVSLQLNPLQTWKTSPVLPATWPLQDKRVMFLFYPMADNPGSMSHYQLFSAKWLVTVSLDDGTTEVSELKARKLGTIEDKRASVLERSEIELAERSLVHLILAGEDDAADGENSFWGYLKFFHEHPKFASDIQRKSPKFVAWLTRKGKRRRG